MWGRQGARATSLPSLARPHSTPQRHISALTRSVELSPKPSLPEAHLSLATELTQRPRARTANRSHDARSAGEPSPTAPPLRTSIRSYPPTTALAPSYNASNICRNVGKPGPTWLLSTTSTSLHSLARPHFLLSSTSLPSLARPHFTPQHHISAVARSVELSPKPISPSRPGGGYPGEGQYIVCGRKYSRIFKLPAGRLQRSAKFRP